MMKHLLFREIELKLLVSVYSISTYLIKRKMKISLFAASLFSLLIFAACDHTENTKTENPDKPFDMATAKSEIDEANREFIDFI